MFDMDSYIMGKKKGQKNATTQINVSSSSIEYDAETKTVTMTTGGNEE